MIQNQVPKILKFGEFDIKSSTVFYYRKYVYACVNLKPISPGHVLLIPTRVVKKFKDLYESEAMELFISSKKIGEALKIFYKADSVQYSIQDGEDAGQTVPHLHMHIIPMMKKIDAVIEDEQRKPRTIEDMENEAKSYSENFYLN